MLDLIGKAYAVAPEIPKLSWMDPSASFTGTISLILGWAITLAAVLAVVYLIYGGIMYITAGGDAEKATKGRTAVVNAIIGIIIIVFSYVIVAWVGRLITVGKP